MMMWEVEIVKREDLLTKTQQYTLVYDRGSSWISSSVVMKALPNGLNLSRYGISVSRRVGNAVVRNRVKRLFREILRQAPLQTGWDIVFIARPAAASINYASLEKSINNLLAQARLLSSEYEKVYLRTN